MLWLESGRLTQMAGKARCSGTGEWGTLIVMSNELRMCIFLMTHHIPEITGRMKVLRALINEVEVADQER